MNGMKSKILLLISLFFLSIGTALGQTITVKGIVLDEKGEPVIGASVRLKSNPSVGAATGLDGDFTLKAKQGELIIVSYVGYKTQEVAAAPSLTIKLAPDQELLDEVVVVGYGTSTKRSFTGSAVTVNAAALEKKSVSNVSQALAGEVPGVNVVNTNGQPGSSADIYVRGVGSVNASTAPLYVVDGVPFDGSISAINPADIESTTLLKDAAATAIYGARGANGVILINTKKGVADKTTVSAEFKYGVNTQFIPRHDVVTDPEDYLALSWQGLYNQWSDLPAMIRDKEGNKIPNPAKKLTPDQFASMNVFSTSGINEKYNFYKETDGSKIFDTNGKVRPNLARRYTPENWKDFAFQPSARMEANVQVAGGSQKARSFLSVGMLDDKGISKNSRFTRFSGRLNGTYDPTTWLQVKGNLAYTYSKSKAAGQSEYSSTNIFTFLDNMPPIYPVFERDKDGNMKESPYFKGLNEFDFGEGRGYGGQSNALSIPYYEEDLDTKNQVTYNLGSTIRIIDGLSFENTFSGMYYNRFAYDRGSMWYGDAGNSHGTIYHYHNSVYSWNLLSLLRYTTRIADNHNLEAFVAHESSRYKTSKDAISKKNLIDPFDNELSNALEMSSPASGGSDAYAMESYFFQANYDYAGKYFVSGTFRRDGSSRFLKNRWGNFGSIGLAWVLSSEDFMKNVKAIDFLKLKASFGSLGQQGGISYYSGNDLYKIKNLNGKGALLFDKKGNPELTWERSNMLQLGFELNMLNRISLNVEYFNKITTDLIYERRVAPSNGYALYNVNDGKLQNQGIDIDLGFNILKNEDYFLDLKLNGGFVFNKMLTLPIEPSSGEPKFIDDSASPYGRMKGMSLYEYYMKNYVGVNPENGKSEWTMYFVDNDKNGQFSKGDMPIESLVQYKHENPDKVGQIVEGKTQNYSKATRYHVGYSALPVVRGGINIAGGYKGVELSVQFIYSLGGYGYDNVYASLMNSGKAGSQNWHKDIHNAWMPNNKNTNVPRLSNGQDTDVASLSTRFLTSNSFLNLANVRLAYNLPKSWLEDIKVNNASIWVSGDNLFLLSARRGFNPSTSLSGRSSSYTYSPLSTITGGIRVTF
ncbi:TonB-dependent receptor P26 [Porphyromonas levii]|nr:TonB-dependent receptor P26 [Porphyromonas levii]